jgi:ABC-type multidrug transport system ATPase subunit
VNVAEYPLAGSIAWLYADAVIHLIIAWYLDNIVPGEFGVKLPFWFVFSPKYWKHHFCTKPPANPLPAPSAPSVPPSSAAAVEVSGLVKMFRKNALYESSHDKLAVNGVSFTINEGEVFSFLGHNGAGKTTTINLLCGMYEASGGDALIYGRSIRTEMSAVRGSFGLCAQQDIFYPELDVSEHLRFYGRIKGMRGAELEASIAKTIASVGLVGKEHAQCGTLSGGMKRKLSLGIAYLGDSKFVVLDEPTAGLDPASRRLIWKIVEDHKPGRATLLTTHMMDEADILGDVIGIIGDGVMKCIGPSAQLKRDYGVGLHLEVGFDGDVQESQANAVLDVIKLHVPDAQRLACRGNMAS